MMKWKRDVSLGVSSVVVVLALRFLMGLNLLAQAGVAEWACWHRQVNVVAPPSPLTSGGGDFAGWSVMRCSVLIDFRVVLQG
jgi:hypothetical protein